MLAGAEVVHHGTRSGRTADVLNLIGYGGCQAHDRGCFFELAPVRETVQVDHGPDRLQPRVFGTRDRTEPTVRPAVRVGKVWDMDTVIIGAGGFGREVLDVLRAVAGQGSSISFLGFIDDGTPDPGRLMRLDAQHLGGTEILARFSGCGYVVAVGDPAGRAVLAATAESAGLKPVSLLHPSATFGADVNIAPGTVICAGVRLTTNIRVGRHVHINLNTTIGHDSTIEDLVTLNPQAAISGDVHLGQGATVGTTASINQGLRIGAGATVGAGAAVVKDVPPGVIVVGVPARQLTG